jgi:ketosteroid isomerase-like protein
MAAVGASIPPTPPCDVRQAEQEVRDTVSKAVALRARQDERFLSYYATDEYSFPGESWVFSAGDRRAVRTQDIRSARRKGASWRMEIRDLRLKAGCDLAWVAGFVRAERLDSDDKVTHQAEWRLTAVLERRSSGWLIVHQHSSRPIADPREWWRPATAGQAR